MATDIKDGIAILDLDDDFAAQYDAETVAVYFGPSGEYVHDLDVVVPFPPEGGPGEIALMIPGGDHLNLNMNLTPEQATAIATALLEAARADRP